jgi:hypothetical protein
LLFMRANQTSNVLEFMDFFGERGGTRTLDPMIKSLMPPVCMPMRGEGGRRLGPKFGPKHHGMPQPSATERHHGLARRAENTTTGRYWLVRTPASQCHAASVNRLRRNGSVMVKDTVRLPSHGRSLGEKQEGGRQLHFSYGKTGRDRSKVGPYLCGQVAERTNIRIRVQ